jgi:N-acetylglucosamine malate deacetylase 1
LKNIIKRLLLKLGIRRRTRAWGVLFQRGLRYEEPVVLTEPGGGRIAVLAPHMDDEVLGCGGTIARHVQAGASVTVIFLTDGRHGGISSGALPESERARRQQELIEIRKQEARRAGEILGVQSVIFLDAEDRQLGADASVAQRLRDALERWRPDIVYLPFFLDRHPDHRAANDVLLTATAGTALDFECRGYEVWTPLFPNRLVRIDDTMEIKRSAMACYQSQVREMDYLHYAIGLNAYRSSALGKGGRFAEAFHALSLADYRRFHRAVCRPS